MSRTYRRKKKLNPRDDVYPFHWYDKDHVKYHRDGLHNSDIKKVAKWRSNRSERTRERAMLRKYAIDPDHYHTGHRLDFYIYLDCLW